MVKAVKFSETRISRQVASSIHDANNENTTGGEAMSGSESQNRRPITARSASWAQSAASFLVSTRVTPNHISVASIAFAIAGSFLLVTTHIGWPALLGCVLCIQGRLICNLLDGMVAVEGGKKSPLGALYNEFPDRIADSILIVALGYAVDLPWLGWLGALLAAMTAYVRVFGGSLGMPQDFRGPMAKQHRMAAMTAGCVVGAAELAVFGTRYALTAAALAIAAGSFATCITRTLAIAEKLERA
jgi:phosphatidylglycerophosphate synthase